MSQEKLKFLKVSQLQNLLSLRLVHSWWIFEFKESAYEFQVETESRVRVCQESNDNDYYSLQTSKISKEINDGVSIPYVLFPIRRQLKVAPEILESHFIFKQIAFILYFVVKFGVHNKESVRYASLSHLQPPVIDNSLLLWESEFVS